MPSEQDANTQAILTLTQWLSPAFPTGAFAYSSGLEGAVSKDWVRDIATFETWLLASLEHGSGTLDARYIVAAFRTQSLEIAEQIDVEYRAFQPSEERLLEARALGKAFARALSPWSMAQAAIPKDACLPVALGAAVQAQKLPLDICLTLYLQNWSSNLVSAAQRLAPIGQTEAQNFLRSLAPRFVEIANDIATEGLSNLSATAFLTDIASMHHETQYTRIFRT